MGKNFTEIYFYFIILNNVSILKKLTRNVTRTASNRFTTKRRAARGTSSSK